MLPRISNLSEPPESTTFALGQIQLRARGSPLDLQAISRLARSLASSGSNVPRLTFTVNVLRADADTLLQLCRWALSLPVLRTTTSLEPEMKLGFDSFTMSYHFDKSSGMLAIAIQDKADGGNAICVAYDVPAHCVTIWTNIADVTRLIEWIVLEICALAGEILLLHAACACIADSAIVLAGPSGSGKTSLLVGLVLSGGKVIADDRVAIMRSGYVPSIYRDIFMNLGVETVNAFPTLHETSRTWHQSYSIRLQGDEWRFHVSDVFGRDVVASGAHLRTVIFPSRTQRSGYRLSPILTLNEFIARVTPCYHSLAWRVRDALALSRLADNVEDPWLPLWPQMRAYVLEYGPDSLQDAVSAIQRQCMSD